MTTYEGANDELLRYFDFDSFNSRDTETAQNHSSVPTQPEAETCFSSQNFDSQYCQLTEENLLNPFPPPLETPILSLSDQNCNQGFCIAPASVTTNSEKASYHPVAPSHYFPAPFSTQIQDTASFDSCQYNLTTPVFASAPVAEKSITSPAFVQFQETSYPGFSDCGGFIPSFVPPIPASSLSPFESLSEAATAHHSQHASSDPFNFVQACSQAAVPNINTPPASYTSSEFASVSFLPEAQDFQPILTQTHPQQPVSNTSTHEALANTLDSAPFIPPASEPIFVFSPALTNSGQDQTQALIPIFVTSEPLGRSVSAGFFPTGSSFGEGISRPCLTYQPLPTPRSTPDILSHNTGAFHYRQCTIAEQQGAGPSQPGLSQTALTQLIEQKRVPPSHQKMPGHKRGPWTQGEDALLLDLVRQAGASNWVRISTSLGTRSAKQCRERYHQNLKPNLNKDPITAEEGRQIEAMVQTYGTRWAYIAKKLKGRSDNAIKNWYNGSVNRRRRLREAVSKPGSVVGQNHQHQQLVGYNPHGASMPQTHPVILPNPQNLVPSVMPMSSGTNYFNVNHWLRARTLPPPTPKLQMVQPQLPSPESTHFGSPIQRTVLHTCRT